MEVGFRYFSYLLYKLNIGPQGIFVVSSVLLMFALYCFLKCAVNEKYWLFAVFLFVCGGYFFASLNILRQYMAIAIMLLGAYSWMQNRRIVAFCLLGIAAFFHSAVLIVIAVPIIAVLLKTKHRTALMLGLYGLTLFITVLGVSNVASAVLLHIPRWSQYANSHWVTDRNLAAGLKVLMPNLILLSALFQQYRENHQGGYSLENPTIPNHLKDDYFERFITAGTICYVLIFTCVFGFVTLTRLSEFFFPFYIAFVCRFLEKQPKYIKFIYWVLIVSYYLLLTTGAVFIQDTNSVLPYRSIFG
jgi:hypothetical protein